MRRGWALLLVFALFGCALDDGFEDHSSGAYQAVPQGTGVPYQDTSASGYQQGWAAPGAATGAACASRSGVVPAAYSPPPPQTQEPPR